FTFIQEASPVLYKDGNELDDSLGQTDSVSGVLSAGRMLEAAMSDDGDGPSDVEEEEEEEEEAGGDDNANAGWAEVMAKILGKKTSEGQSSILVKNKDLDKMKAKEKQEQLERRKQVQTVAPHGPDEPLLSSESRTQQFLRKGVVQLFNAVRKHQKTVDDKVKEAGGSERKKAKVLSSVSKKDFIDVLRRAEGGAQEKPAWSVLREDFMMEASMKDWDKDSDREEAGAPAGGEQGSDSD
uniref:RRP15-like protein n=1 Tax=Stegastes partitus TaxID=144197 RepID=A0A3B5AU39_9TELE